MGNPFEYTPEEQRLRARRDPAQEWRPPLLPDTEENLANSEETKVRTVGWTIILTLTGAVIIGRLFMLQIAAGQQYRNLAEGNSVRAIQITPERGIVFDYLGRILTRNTKRVVAVVNIDQLPSNITERTALFNRLRQIIGVTDESIAEMNRLRDQQIAGEYQIGTNLTKTQHLLLKELASENAAIGLVERAMRQYETGDGLAHILGYVGQVTEKDVESGQYSHLDQVGKNGLERSYEERLRGQTGVQMTEVDASGQYLTTLADDRNREPQMGDSLRLTVNLDWQRQIAAILREALSARDSQFPEAANLGGSIIVMEPSTGRLRAFVSLPDYDNNLFARGITSTELNGLINDPKKPLVCRAVYGLYPPGSTIKPLVASGALYYRIVSPTYSVDTPAAITVGGHDFPDWKDHGTTNIRTAIAESNNIFFYMLGGGWQNISGLGLDRLRETVHWFGYERPTNIDLPGEQTGYFLSVERKRRFSNEPVYLGDVYHVAIGQGDIGVTPIQVATATAAVANGGTVYEPRLVESYVNANNEQPREIVPTVAGKLPLAGSDLQVVREGMRQAVVRGSSTPLADLSVELSGKTGTAQFGTQDLTHAWFTGFGPFENPQYVVTVIIEGGGGSFEAAVPVAEKVFRLLFNEPAA